jgi:hypothetical protein
MHQRPYLLCYTASIMERDQVFRQTIGSSMAAPFLNIVNLSGRALRREELTIVWRSLIAMVDILKHHAHAPGATRCCACVPVYVDDAPVHPFQVSRSGKMSKEVRCCVDIESPRTMTVAVLPSPSHHTLCSTRQHYTHYQPHLCKTRYGGTPSHLCSITSPAVDAFPTWTCPSNSAFTKKSLRRPDSAATAAAQVPITRNKHGRRTSRNSATAHHSTSVSQSLQTDSRREIEPDRTSYWRACLSCAVIRRGRHTSRPHRTGSLTRQLLSLQRAKPHQHSRHSVHRRWHGGCDHGEGQGQYDHSDPGNWLK